MADLEAASPNAPLAASQPPATYRIVTDSNGEGCKDSLPWVGREDCPRLNTGGVEAVSDSSIHVMVDYRVTGGMSARVTPESTTSAPVGVERAESPDGAK
jgi:hypothetical protein